MVQKTNVLILFLCLLATPVPAAQIAVVVTDGAMVYKHADFDSAVIAYIDQGRRMKVSSKTFGPFYRIQLKQGVLGYIADTDLSIEGKANEPEKPEEKKDSKDKKVTKKQSSKPISQRTSIGLAGGLLSFKEVINREERSQSLPVYGLKLSLPFSVFEGLFQLQVNVLGSFSAPDYYKDYVTGGSPSGTMLWFDSTMDFALAHLGKNEGVVYLGAGPLVNYNQIKVETQGRQLNLQDAKLGASFVLGLAYWLGPVVLRVEPKYFVEKASYFGGALGLQIDL